MCSGACSLFIRKLYLIYISPIIGLSSIINFLTYFWSRISVEVSKLMFKELRVDTATLGITKSSGNKGGQLFADVLVFTAC